MVTRTRRKPVEASPNGTTEAEPISDALVPVSESSVESTDNTLTLQALLRDFAVALTAGNDDLVTRFGELLNDRELAILTAIVDYRALQIEMSESMARLERDRGVYEARIDTLERQVEGHAGEIAIALSRRDNDHLLELDRIGREHTAEIARVNREHSAELDRIQREHTASITKVTGERDEARAEARTLTDQLAGIAALTERVEAVESRGWFGRKKN